MLPQNLNLSRREWLRLSAAGGIGVSASGWMEALAAHAGEKQPRKKCILVWLDGGPSHHDTFDMKPEAPDDIRGEYKPIDTSAPGVQITEMLPDLATQMHHATVIRSMSTLESAHPRARVHMHTGYRLGAGGLSYPTLGSIVSHDLGPAENGMPNFVVTGMHLNPANHSYVSSPGYLGPKHRPLIVPDPAAGVENLKPTVEQGEFNARLSVLEELSQGFVRSNVSGPATAHQAVYSRAVQLMRSDKAKAFDLQLEKGSVREKYGDFTFGKACLLARRLIEVDVPFVEVYHCPTPGGFDNHTPQRTKEVKTLALPQLNQALPALIADLHDRGLLGETLVIAMGEFGRTPKVGKGATRDHYARAWSSLLFGGGVPGGTVIGRTDKKGAAVEDRPVSAIDFLATICTILGVDYTKENYAGARPVSVVDHGAAPIKELTS